MSNLSSSLSRFLLRWKFSAFDQYATLYKQPANSRIVVFSAHSRLLDALINKQFSKFGAVDVSQLASQNANEEELTDAVAKSLSSPNTGLKEGFFVQHFPRNTSQASRLDTILDGVNLAINITFPDSVAKELAKNYLECVTCGRLYNSSFDFTAPQQPGSTEKCDNPTKCNIVEGTKNTSSEVSEYNKNFAPVFDYYAKRGTLLTFEVDPSWTLDEANARLRDEILSAIKL